MAVSYLQSGSRQGGKLLSSYCLHWIPPGTPVSGMVLFTFADSSPPQSSISGNSLTHVPEVCLLGSSKTLQVDTEDELPQHPRNIIMNLWFDVLCKALSQCQLIHAGAFTFPTCVLLLTSCGKLCDVTSPFWVLLHSAQHV